MYSEDKTISENVAYALNSPSKRLVVTGPIQCGITSNLTRMAIDRSGNLNKILYIANDRNVGQHSIDMLKRNSIYGKIDNIAVSNGSNIERQLGETDIAFHDMVSRKRVLLSDYSEIYVDNAAFLKQNVSLLVSILELVKPKRIVICSTGSNNGSWHDTVNRLCNLNFTAIFFNVPDRNNFDKIEKMIGSEAFKSEFEVNTK